MTEQYWKLHSGNHCDNCGRPKSEHRQYRDNKPPHCPTVDPMPERKLPVVGEEIGTPPPEFNWTLRKGKRALVMLDENGEVAHVFELHDAGVLREAADWLEAANNIPRAQANELNRHQIAVIRNALIGWRTTCVEREDTEGAADIGRVLRAFEAICAERKARGDG